MTNSSKKKKERKQDFQKQKLKVGKARPKNTNATDTRFAAKSIVLKTFQNLLSWTAQGSKLTSASGAKWSNTKSSGSLGSNKLLVHQVSTLAKFLSAGLTRRASDPDVLAVKAAQMFPLWHTNAHVVPAKSNCYGYLNLFGAPRDLESEMYDDADERIEALHESGLYDIFKYGVSEIKKEGGEVGRVAAGLDKALRLAEQG